MKQAKKQWKIGELASETGLTVRTLHYYDEIALLRPTFESEGGHRLYGRLDLERLQKILTLKQLGFSLEKIKQAIEQPDFSMKDAAVQLRADLRKRKQELEEIDARLAEVENLQKQQEVSSESILQLVAQMNLLDRHLSKQQIEWIKEHNLQFGPEKLVELRSEWAEATAAVQQAIDDGLSPLDWRTKAICMRWFGLASAFMGGSLDLVYDLKNIIRTEPQVASQLGIPGADLARVFEFVETVLTESKNTSLVRALAYAQVAVRDLDKARKFYDRVLSPLAIQPIFQKPSEIIYGKTNPEFFISTETFDKKPVSFGNGYCVGFWTESTEQVDLIYKYALEAGGTSLVAPAFEGKHLYRAYFCDLDGNTLEIMKWFDDPDRPTG